MRVALMSRGGGRGNLQQNLQTGAYNTLCLLIYSIYWSQYINSNVRYVSVSLYVRVQDNYIFFFVDRSIESVNKKKMFDIVYRVCIYLVVEVR